MLKLPSGNRFRQSIAVLLGLLLITCFIDFRASLNAIALVALLSLIIVVVSHKDYHSLPRHFSVWPLSLLSFAFAHLLAALVHGRVEDIGLMQGVVESSVMVFFLYVLLLNKEGIPAGLSRIIYPTLCAGVVLIGVLSFYQWATKGFDEAIALGTQAINSSVATRLLIVTVPFVLLTRMERPLPMALVLICALAGFVSVVLSYSRMAVLCILMISIASITTLVIQQYLKTRSILIPGMVGTVLLGAGLFLILKTTFIEEVIEGFANIARYITDGDGHTSVGARLEMWSFSIKALAEHPLVGIGSGTLSERMGENIQLYRVDGAYQHVHNNLLESWLATGLLGFVGALLMLVYPVLTGLRYFRFTSGRVLLFSGGSFLMYCMIAAPLTRQFSLLYYMLFVSLNLVLLHSELMSEKARESSQGHNGT